MTRKYGRLNETRNYVIDLETLGLGPDAIVTSAALAQFDAKSTRLIATWTIDTKAQEDLGRVMDADTVMWWLKQSDAARSSITSKEAQRRKVSPLVFLKDLFAIMREDHASRPSGGPRHPIDDGRESPWERSYGDDNFTLWAKPQHFDIGILTHMAQQCQAPTREVCLHRRRVHNVRTALAIVNLVRAGIDWPEDLDETPNPGAHDAAADAMVTAAVMRDALKEIEGFTGLLNLVRESMEKHAALPPVVPQAKAPRVLQSADDAPCGSLIRPYVGHLTVRLPNGRGWFLEASEPRGYEHTDATWRWHYHHIKGPADLIAEDLTETECRHLSGLSAADAIAWCEAMDKAAKHEGAHEENCDILTTRDGWEAPCTCRMQDKAAKPRPQSGDVVPWAEVEDGCLYQEAGHPDFRMVTAGGCGLMHGPDDVDIDRCAAGEYGGTARDRLADFHDEGAAILVARDLGTDPEAWRKAMREWTARAPQDSK